MAPQAHRDIQVASPGAGLKEREHLLPKDRDVADHYAARAAIAPECEPTN